MILASASPRRLALLRAGGVDPMVRPAHVDEAPLPGESATALVRRLAAAKAAAVDGAVVLGADTVVELDGTVLGKPDDATHAAAMLRSLSGQVLAVWSGVAVRHDGRISTRVVGSSLRFRELADRDIEAYLATGEPLGVAGAFRIQGQGAGLVADRTGCWTNVVGLPTCQAAVLLAAVGITLTPDGCPPDPSDPTIQTPTAS